MSSEYYFLNIDEYINAQYLIYLKQKRGLILGISFIFCLLTGIGLLLWIIFLIFETIIGEKLSKSNNKKKFINENIIEIKHEINIDNNLIKYSTDNFDIRSDLNQVKNIYVRDNVLIIYLKEKINIIIPKRILKSQILEDLRNNIPFYFGI